VFNTSSTVITLRKCGSKEEREMKGNKLVRWWKWLRNSVTEVCVVEYGDEMDWQWWIMVEVVVMVVRDEEGGGNS
jgi:hypothetical protein